MTQLDLDALVAGLPRIGASPADEGTLALIVRRPVVEARETLAEAVLDAEEGLVGDSWRARGAADPKAQLTLMNIHVASLVAGTPDRVPLAGDQLYVDLDLREANLPPGTKLRIGGALLEISDEPHNGCRKFMERFGRDAHRFVSGKEHRHLNLRGLNAFVVAAGTVRVGDRVSKAR